jgi:hypothetical protein
VADWARCPVPHALLPVFWCAQTFSDEGSCRIPIGTRFRGAEITRGPRRPNDFWDPGKFPQSTPKHAAPAMFSYARCKLK